MAIEKVISIVSSELKAGKSGKQYLDITDQDGVRFSCWEESLWNFLGKNTGVIIEFEQKGIFRNISSAKPVEGELPLAEKPKPPIINTEEGAMADEPTIKGPAPQGISGAETGRCWNDIRELWLHDKMATLFGRENAIEIAKQYRGYLLSTLKLNYDGAKLPKWETKEIKKEG